MAARKATKTKARKRKRAKRASDYPPELLLHIFNAQPLEQIVGLSANSIDRYRNRFRPGYSPAQAKAELIKRITREGRFVIEPPKWLGYGTDDTQAIGYVTIADEFALPVVEKPKQKPRFVASTTLYGYLL